MRGELNQCPACNQEQYDGEGCSACGFGQGKYKNYSKSRYKRVLVLLRKKEKEKKKPKIKLVRVLDRNSSENLQRQRDENFERRAGAIAGKIGRSVMSEVEERAKEFIPEHHPQARWKLLKRVVEEIKEYL